ncbi:MAG: formate dehydrogenase accessory sulfurtransferase FdhD [Saprospiraceae bacterium]|nr:formate dehydrogenase accessory sulfurtransferase FdhD [Saprospiraceae bacterium]
MKSFEILKIKNGKAFTTDDFVIEETSLTIYINQKEFVTILCSNEDLEDLVVGYVFSAGIIQNKEQIKRVDIDHKNQIANIEIKELSVNDTDFIKLQASGCGRGTMFFNKADNFYNEKIKSDIQISIEKVFELMNELQHKSENFANTGGVHSAALTDKNELLLFRDDIGRHNAVDKIIGNAIKNNINLNDKVLLSTGRISSEIILKILYSRIPIIISRSAPTSRAVEIAREKEITLIGFARSGKMNIYSKPERIQY